MPDSVQERLARLEEQLRTVTLGIADLAREIDEGSPSRPSIRARLHDLEGTAAAARKLTAALEEMSSRRVSRWDQVRNWGGWITAVVAIVVSQHPWS